MAKSRRVTFELPAAAHKVLEQAAEENGINVQAAASLILQSALTRRISGLVPKRAAKAATATDDANPGRAAVPVSASSPGSVESND